MSVTVEGADRLKATLAVAAVDLADMSETNRITGLRIQQRGASNAPRLTGALAASLTVDSGVEGTEVSSGLVYAGRTHWGWAAVGQRPQPFLSDALAQTEAQALGDYTAAMRQALSKVRGA